MIDWLAALDPLVVMVAIAGAGVLLALPFELAAISRLRRVRLVSGTMFFLVGALVLMLAVVAALVVTNLFTYARLTHEQDVARVSLRQLGERHFVASVQPNGAAARHFELRGDEWQIDARVLKWQPMATLLGFDTAYRLERLSGRYASVADERSQPRTVHDLAKDDPTLDVWVLVRRHHRYLPFVDAMYGSAAYVPMLEAAEYAVTVSASGLVVRPVNEAAKKAVGGWR
jgi:hypothetical protein